MTSDRKIEYLELLQEQQAAIHRMLAGGAMLIEGGPEGMREVANLHPDVVLAAFAGTIAVLQDLWKEHVKLTEDHFKALDEIESLKNDPQS